MNIKDVTSYTKEGIYSVYIWTDEFVAFRKDDAIPGQDDLIAKVCYEINHSTLAVTYTETSPLYILKEKKLRDILFLPDNGIYPDALELEEELEDMCILISQVIA